MSRFHNYRQDSEGNWGEEITFSDLEHSENMDVHEIFTDRDSVFYREPSTDEEIERKDKRLAFIQMALGSLTPKQREIIILAFNHHKSNREIALILDISEKTVSTHKTQALKKLRKVLMGK